MLQHISETKVLQQFSGARKMPSSSSNVVSFPGPQPGGMSTGPTRTISDWRQRPITKWQFRYICSLAKMNGINIAKLNERCYRQFGADLSSMARPDASDVIQALERQYDDIQNNNLKT